MKKTVLEYFAALGKYILIMLCVMSLVLAIYFIVEKITYSEEKRLAREEQTCREYGKGLIMSNKATNFECETYFGDDGNLHYRIVFHDIDAQTEKYYYPDKKY